MRRNYQRNIVICLLSLTLLFTFGIPLQSTNQPLNHALAYTPSPTDFLQSTRSLPQSPMPQTLPLLKDEILIAEVVEQTEQVKVNAEVHMASYKLVSPTTVIHQKKKSNTYVVTAHFLNVRAKPSSKADIINVVKEGDYLEVLKLEDSTWLQLEGGGYVHADYAKQSEQLTSNQIDRSLIGSTPAAVSKKQAPVSKRQAPGKPSSKVKSESGLTEDHISTIFKGTALEDEGLEEAILEIEQEYGINAYFTIAVLKLESGNGKSRLAKNKNNLFGLNAIDGDAINKAFTFKTKGDSVRKFGQLISKHYVGKGYTTIEKVASKYCPANDDWSSLVTSIMKGDYKKL